jgi:hypothetical protein
MSIKKQLKSIPVFYKANALLKGKFQERRAARELAYYRLKAFEGGMNLPEGEELVRELRKRLFQRSIYPTSKRRGKLHIFLIYPLNNWEAVLPIALKPFS